MIIKPLIHNDNIVITLVILCCLIILAVIMIPRVISYRKKLKENETILIEQDQEVIEGLDQIDNEKPL